MPDESKSHLAALRQGTDQFYTRFIRVGAIAMGTLGLLGAIIGITTRHAGTIIGSALGVAVFGAAYALTFRASSLLGCRIFVYGLMLNTLGSAISLPVRLDGLAVNAVLATLGVMLAGFTLRRVDLLVTALFGLGAMGVTVGKQIAASGYNPDALSSHVISFGIVVVEAIAISLFTSHAQNNQGRLHTYVEEVDRVMTHAERIAKGDLTGTVDGDSEVSGTIRAMLEGLRTMVTRMQEAAAALSSSAREIAAMSRQQEQGAVEQASAVMQVHKTLAKLLDGSNHAAHSTEEVFRNVEMTQKTSEVVAQRAAALSAHTRRISAILEIIKAIANKSEILALNAALEGARAGEAGRGFSLVASQMQRLAESVMDSVRDVRVIIDDIESATSATLAATEESTQLSSKATNAARQISVTLQQQRGSTEQVATAMRDIQQVTTQVSAGSTQSLSATNDLTRLAEELKRAIEGFRL